MMKKFKNNKGVTLVALAIAVAVIMILTNVIVYNAIDGLRANKLRNLQTDIENLRDKVSNYYAQYGAIPVKYKYTNTDNINKIDSISSATDTGEFYVIDLSAMENVTLNYGRDYEKIGTDPYTTEDRISELTDIYIINTDSHNIFYVAGIETNGEIYYTDYTKDNKDTVPVEIRSYEGVEIPIGFYYVGGTKETGIVISDVKGDDLDNTKKGNQFVWIPVESEEEYVRNTEYMDVNVSATAYADKDYLPDGIQPSLAGLNTPEEIGEKNEDAERQAILKAKGFYVSRFEAGKENIDGKDTLVSKKGVSVWGDTISQEGAKLLAKEFENNEDVKSALISGIQWDVIMNFINGKVTGNDTIIDVTSVSNEIKIDEKNATGQNDKDIVCNIYDLVGNYVEYCAERHTYNDDTYVYRGSCYRDETTTPSYRGYSSGTVSEAHTFRFVLYVI